MAQVLFLFSSRGGNSGLDRLDRRLGLRAVGPARLGEVAPAAPPRPPSACAPALTRLTASSDRRDLGDADGERRLAVAPRVTMAAMPEPSSRLRSSISPFSSPAGTPSRTRPKKGMPPTSRARPRRSSRNRRRACGEARRARARGGAFLDEIGDAGADLFLAHFEAVRDVAERLALGVEMGASGVAGERLDAANARGDPLSEVMARSPISPVRPTWVPPQSSIENGLLEPARLAHRDDAHTSPYFSPNKARAPLARASSSAITRISTGASCRMAALAVSSTRRSSSGVSGRGCEKSKRSLSGATSEPFCATCSPSTRRSASCARWVAE